MNLMHVTLEINAVPGGGINVLRGVADHAHLGIVPRSMGYQRIVAFVAVLSCHNLSGYSNSSASRHKIECGIGEYGAVVHAVLIDHPGGGTLIVTRGQNGREGISFLPRGGFLIYSG